ncbi:hypothetical protein ACH58_27355 [Achromobacter xylosoxidans]|nr:hypothetical protein ACH58_27355 [Achromobacter xylosoxidans]
MSNAGASASANENSCLAYSGQCSIGRLRLLGSLIRSATSSYVASASISYIWLTSSIMLRPLALPRMKPCRPMAQDTLPSCRTKPWRGGRRPHSRSMIWRCSSGAGESKA